MKKYVHSAEFLNRDDRFQLDLNSAIYNAIADTVFKYNDLITDEKALESAVETAVDFWSVHYFESDNWNG